MIDEHDDETIDIDLSDADSTDIHEENDVNKPSVIPDGKPVLRDANGKFLPGTARGPGRPHGAKSQFNKQVVDSLQALWEKDGATMLEQLAAEKPEVIMAMVSRLIPTQLAAEAITGEKDDDASKNTDVRITLINQVKDDALPHHEVPRLVEGEIVDEVETKH